MFDPNMFRRKQGINQPTDPMNMPGGFQQQQNFQPFQQQQEQPLPDPNGMIAGLQAQQQQRPMANPFRRFRL